MRTLIILLLPFLFGSMLNAQVQLEVDGKVKVTDMDEGLSADSVVVWLADSTLAWRHKDSLNNSGWTMNMDTAFTLKYVGIGTSSPSVFGSDRVMEMMADDPNLGSIIQLSNEDRSSFLRLFSGRTGDPHPFLWWKEGGDLRFITDEGGYNERFRINSDGLVTAQNRITNVTDPEDAQDAATKAYVDILETTIKDLIGVKDIDNNRYETVTIGSQVWMAENLRVAHYNDGTPIPLVTDNTAWQDSSNDGNPAYTWYDNGEYGTPDYGAPEYGALYNWYAIDTLSNDGRNVCPTGWHVPTDEDWTVLIDELDLAAVDPNAVGVQSSVSGGKMKETGLGHWNAQNTGATNKSGFSGLPGGNRGSNGTFFNIGNVGYWWSSTEVSASYAWNRTLNYNNGDVYRNGDLKGLGLSVRCLRD